MFRSIDFSKPLIQIAIVTLLAVTAALGVLPASAAPVTYYIDCVAGNDGNNGTSTSTPWRTFANVNGRVFLAGDSLLLKRGTVCSGIGGMTPKGSGTPTSPITIGSYGTGALPHIQAGTNNAIALTDIEGWVVQDVHLSSSPIPTGNNEGYAGIYLNTDTTTKTYFRILNVEATGNWFGMLLGRYKPKESILGTLNDVVVDGANVHNNDGPGIEASGVWKGNSTGQNEPPRNENMIVRNSQFIDNGKDGVVLTAAHNGLIEYNFALRNGLSGDDRFSFWFWNSNDVIIQFNESADMRTTTTKGGGGLDCDYHVTNCIAQYNYSHDSMGPGILLIGYGNETLDGCTVRYNIFERDARAEFQNGVILPFGSVRNCKVYNNTTYFNNTTNAVAGNGGAYAILAWTWGGFGKGANNTYSNNIFYLERNPAFPLSGRGARIETGQIGSGILYDHNLWYATNGNINYDYANTIYNTVSAVCAGTGHECTSIQANPLLTAVNTGPNGYTLQAGSPAINAGLVFDVNNGGRDYFGNGVPQGGAPDMGAFESSSGGGPTPTPTRTNTPLPPTNTPTQTPTPGGPTNTPTPTNTPVTPTNTPTRTNTPVPGSGIAFVKNIGSAACGDATNTITVPAGGVAAGNTLIARVTIRDSSPAGTVTITDSKGNTYTQDKDFTHSGMRIILASANVTTALVSGDTITVAEPAANSTTGFVVSEFSGIAATNRVDVSNSAGGGSANPSVSVTTTNANDLVYGLVGTINAGTYTEPSGWATDAHLSTNCGGAQGNSTNHGAYRIVSATGAYTYNPTLSASLTWAEAVVAYKAQ